MIEFELDADAQRADGRLRAFAAASVIAAIAWLGAQGAGPAGVLLLFVAGLAALGWLASWWRSRSLDPSEHWLRLGDEALEMSRAGKRSAVRWSQVREVIADEDRVAVRVVSRDGNELVVPLVWRGVGLHDLAERIDTARDAALAPAGPLTQNTQKPESTTPETQP